MREEEQPYQLFVAVEYLKQLFLPLGVSEEGVKGASVRWAYNHSRAEKQLGVSEISILGVMNCEM